MPTYTWNPPAPAQFVDWNTPADWLPTMVPNAADADVVIPEITDSSGDPYDFFVTIGATESYVVNSLTLVQQYLILDGTLAIGAGLTMGTGSEIDITGSLSVGSLTNGGAIDIQGSGQISSANSLENSGDIVGSGLTLAVAGLRNDGTLIASDSLELDTNSFANLVNGTLSGGTYESVDGGVLSLNVGADIVTDAATIILGAPHQGAPSVIQTVTSADATPDGLTQTLRTIAPKGVLSLQGAGYTAAAPLFDGGQIDLTGATLATPSLTIEAGGTVSGSGTIAGPVENDGLLSMQQGKDDLGDVTSGTLVLDNAVTGVGTIAIQAPGLSGFGADTIVSNTLELAGAVTNAVAFADWNGVLVLDSPTLFAGPTSGFVAGTDTSEGRGGGTYEQSDSIILKGLSAADITNVGYSGNATAGTLSFKDSGTSVALAFVGDYSLGDFVLKAGPQALSTSPPSIEITEVLPCFLAGTRLLTERGEVPVEQLAVGDFLRTDDGGLAPVRWIGHRRVDASRHKRPDDVWPICVRENAFGMGRPGRDVWLSPDHAVFAEGVLIPIRYLLNGTTIVQTRRSPVVYFHVELPRHDVVLADGLPCESYLDLGNRAAFANGGGVPALHPDFGRRVWEREGHAELLLGGPSLERVRAQVRVQAELLGVAATAEGPALRRSVTANCR